MVRNLDTTPHTKKGWTPNIYIAMVLTSLAYKGLKKALMGRYSFNALKYIEKISPLTDIMGNEIFLSPNISWNMGNVSTTQRDIRI